MIKLRSPSFTHEASLFKLLVEPHRPLVGKSWNLSLLTLLASRVVVVQFVCMLSTTLRIMTPTIFNVQASLARQAFDAQSFFVACGCWESLFVFA